MTNDSRRVLIVDDDREIREALAEALSDAGFIAKFAANGTDALALLRAESFDVILLDLLMPDLDGWSFRIRQKTDPALAAIPVAVLTSSSAPQAAAVDADLVFRKPIDLDALLRGIELLVAKRERNLAGTSLAHTERLAAIGALAAGISHELNNPLTMLVASLGLLDAKLKAAGPLERAELQSLVASASHRSHAPDCK